MFLWKQNALNEYTVFILNLSLFHLRLGLSRSILHLGLPHLFQE